MRYRVYGLVLESDEPLPEVAAFASGPARTDVRFRRLPAGTKRRPDSWFMTWTVPGGGEWMRAARTPAGYCVGFPGLAEFRLDAAGAEIDCVPRPGLPAHTVRHLLLDHVLPLVLNLRGVEALHASAVATPFGAVAFVGPSGSGKSTLAASFHLAGDPVIGDDCAPLLETRDGIRIVPAYPGLRLWSDAADRLFPGECATGPVADYSTKRRVRLEARADAPADGVPLCLAYVLDPVSAKGTQRGGAELSPRDALVELIRAAFRFAVDDRSMLARQMRVLARVAAEVPVRRLSPPRGLDALAEARRAVLDDLADTARAGGAIMPAEPARTAGSPAV